MKASRFLDTAWMKDHQQANSNFRGIVYYTNSVESAYGHRRSLSAEPTHSAYVCVEFLQNSFSCSPKDLAFLDQATSLAFPGESKVRLKRLFGSRIYLYPKLQTMPSSLHTAQQDNSVAMPPPDFEMSGNEYYIDFAEQEIVAEAHMEWIALFIRQIMLALSLNLEVDSSSSPRVSYPTRPSLYFQGISEQMIPKLMSIVRSVDLGN